MKFGLQLWSQSTDWPTFRDHVLAAESAGWESVWTWDHLNAIFGPWEQPIFEGYTLLAATAPLTERIRLGLMVGANTFRNPGLTAKIVTTLDHVTGGRAILGIGGAWFEREHEAFGFETWGSGFGERLDRLDEAVMLIRRLLDGERVTHDGRYYTFRDALGEPRPLQDHLPILVGGSGPTKTLRTVALRADAWNTAGSVDAVRANLANLDRHCADVGRPREEIELTVSFPIVIRDRRQDAESRLAELCAANGIGGTKAVDLLGSPTEVAEAIAPYRDMGFSTVIVRMPAPYDRETIDRIGEVADALDG